MDYRLIFSISEANELLLKGWKLVEILPATEIAQAALVFELP